MQLADFDFDLPDENIALRPVSPRDSARMLRVTPGAPLADLTVADLPGQLRPGDVLVLTFCSTAPRPCTAPTPSAALAVVMAMGLAQRVGCCGQAGSFAPATSWC